MRRLFLARYIKKEIINTFRREPVVLILIFLSIACSSIMISFYSGYTRHMEQKKIDGESGQDSFYVYFYDPLWPVEKKLEIVRKSKVNKGSLMNWLTHLDKRILEDVEITMECKLESDVVEDPAIDNSTLSLATEFIIKDGCIFPPRIEESLKRKNYLKEGRYFNDDDYLNASLVCLPPANESGNLKGIYGYLKSKYALKDDGSYVIDGKRYEPIGVLESFTTIPDVPVTTIRDDLFVKNITFEFTHVLTRYEYETIANDLKEMYGEQAMISPVEIKTIESKNFDTMIYMMILTVSTLSSVVVSFLYDHIISKRINCLQIYRLCGMRTGQIYKVLLGEGMCIAVSSCVMGNILYHFTIMPYLAKKFEYLSDSSSLSVYIIIDCIFVIVSYIFLKISILRRSF